MAKASPAVRSFNGGVFSPLMEGRTDYERYPSAMHQSLNCIVTPQGPAICRSGTMMLIPAYDHGETSTLISMIISNEQGQIIEFAKDRIRFMTKQGLQTYTPVVLTVSSAAGAPIVFTSLDLAASVGDEVALAGFPAQYNLNGEIAQIIGKVGNIYTLDRSFPDLAVVPGTVARVYHIASPYNESQRKALRAIRDVDYMYLLTRGTRPRKLSRFGAYDWRLEEVDFIDGPYMPTNKTTTRLVPGGTGNGVPAMTANNAPSGNASGSTNRPVIAAGGTFLDRTIPYAMTATDFFMGFSSNDEEYWASGTAQGGELLYAPAAPFAAQGYTIHTAKDSNDLDYLPIDFAPSTWTFEGWDGSNWWELDKQENYVLIENDKTVYFPIDNTVAYQSYRIVVTQLRRNGRIEARIRRLVIKSAAASTFALTATSTTGINRDTGFRITDIGRLVRLQGEDGAWRAAKITGYTSATAVTVELLGEPLLSTKPIKNWRLGYWSDGTGWPSVGDIFGQRLYLFGSDEFPNLTAASFVGDLEYFAPTGPNGEVLDESGFAYTVKMEHLSRFRWASSDERGLLLGSGRAEHVIGSSTRDDANITASNFDTRITTRRGSADVEPVRIDQQVLFAQRGAKTLRELSYNYDSAGYRTLNLSKLASSVTYAGFAELDYSAEPYGTVWGRMVDGTIVGQTYDQEENVLGWHPQNFADGIVESVATLAEDDVAQDTLWMQVQRTVNGEPKRYIEYMTTPWSFGMTLADAHYVDCGLRYSGAETSIIYGLQHLEACAVYGLADLIPFGPLTVVDGSITLPMPASNVVVGLGFESIGETMRLENGQQEGTAQGKTKRLNNVKANVWESACGQFGVWNQEQQQIVWDDVEFPQYTFELQTTSLFTGVVGPLITTPGWDREGRIAFRRPKETPLPFNVVALLPQIVTEDAL